MSRSSGTERAKEEKRIHKESSNSVTLTWVIGFVQLRYTTYIMYRKKEANYKYLFITILFIVATVSLILIGDYLGKIILDSLIDGKTIVSSSYGNQAFYGFGIMFLAFSIPYVLKHWFSKILFVSSLILIFFGLTHTLGVVNSGIYILEYQHPVSPKFQAYSDMDKVLVDVYITNGGRRGPACTSRFNLTILSKTGVARQIYVDGMRPIIEVMVQKLHENNVPVVINEDLNCNNKDAEQYLLQTVEYMLHK